MERWTGGGDRPYKDGGTVAWDDGRWAGDCKSPLRNGGIICLCGIAGGMTV